jgi:pilus assembly protein CpaF
LEKEQSLKQFIQHNRQELFCEVADLIERDSVTDIEWDGFKLWVTDLNRGCFPHERKLSDAYVDNLSIRLANIMKVPFNRVHPILEANTEDLRISIWHESRCTKKSMAIRKIPTSLRFHHKKLIEEGYVPEEILNLLENSVIAHCNIVIGGQPHAGKTELLKYLSTFIPANEKVGVYEDNQEIHYRSINPDKKCAEFFVDDRFSYSQIIKAGLRHNIDWTLLSESRGPEVLDLLNSLSTGASCMTTIHLDDLRGLPDRMYNMLGQCEVAEHFINSIYQYIDLGILVECDAKEHRRITQAAFYERTEGKNVCNVLYDAEEGITGELSSDFKKRFQKYGISNPFEKVQSL